MESFLNEHMLFVHNFSNKKSKFKDKKLFNKNKIGSKFNGSNKSSLNLKVTCLLCGKHVEAGGLMNHKKEAHGENPLLGSTVGKPSRSNWVKFYQGGSPGLGKRNS